MDNFLYFHLCDHRIKKNPINGELATVTITNGNDLIDTVINGAIVLEILEVRAIEYDPKDFETVDFYYDNDANEQTYDDIDLGEAYYDDRNEFIVDYSRYFEEGQTISDVLPNHFYEPTLHNRIKWNVKPPKKYQVLANVKYTQTAIQSYAPMDCPICNGKGWFIDIMDKNGTFKLVSGVEKIAQRIVKDLMTTKGSQMHDLNYGSLLKKDAADVSADDDRLFNLIRMVVSEVEDNYLNDQQNMIRLLPPEEILQALITDRVMRHPANPTIIIIQLRIRTMKEEQLFQIGI